ncbi:MAG: hypothetical protein ACO38P_02795 [Phycisphaerales bacterium]
MIHAQNHKVVGDVPSAAIGATATATLTIDTLGYDHVSVNVLRASNSSTVFANVIKVEESDNNSSYSNVTALVGGGTGGFTVPAVSDTATSAVLKMDIDTKSKKRYLKVSYTPGASATVAMVARLGRGEVAPVTASEAGVIGLVKG